MAGERDLDFKCITENKDKAQLFNVLSAIDELKKRQIPIICIFGLGGAGKSTLFNIIRLGAENFQHGEQEVGDSLISITKYPVISDNGDFGIMDTPGVGDLNALVRSLNKLTFVMCGPSINRFICVINGTNRIDQESEIRIRKMRETFEEKSLSKGNLKIVITRRTEISNEKKEYIIEEMKLRDVIDPEDIIAFDIDKSAVGDINAKVSSLLKNIPKTPMKVNRPQTVEIIRTIEKEDKSFFTKMPKIVLASAATFGVLEVVAGGSLLVGAVAGTVVSSVAVGVVAVGYGVYKGIRWLLSD